jgi:hypothetical protein
MKKITLALSFIFSLNAYSQSINTDKTIFAGFLKRMYSSTPFEGVKIVEDYDHQYLISVVSLDKNKYTDLSIMNRVALVKAQSQANTFINGASVSMDMVIKTTETKDSSDKTNTIVESIESIKQNSLGFTQGLELLSNFDNADNKRSVFIYCREIDEKQK